MIYFITIAILVVLIGIYDLHGINKHKYVFYYLVLIILVLTAGLRFRIGLDTIRYMSSFNELPTLFNLSQYNFNDTRYDPIYFLLVIISKTIYNDWVFFQIIHAFLLNSVIFYFIRKNTNYIFFGALLYYIFCFTNFNFEVMRESIAVAFFLLSLNSLINRSWFKYYVFAFVAFLTHSSAMVLFFIPFFTNFKITKSIYLYLIGVFIISILIRDYVEPLLELISITDSISEKTTRYLDSEIGLLGKRLNILGVLNNFIIYILFPLLSIYFLKLKFRIKYKFEFLVALNFFVAILVIQYALFYRYFNYFILIDIILFAEFGGRLSQYVSSKYSMIVVSATFFGVIFLQVYSYFAPIDRYSQLKLYSRYYPYSSVLNPEIDPDRERLFRYYNAY